MEGLGKFERWERRASQRPCSQLGKDDSRTGWTPGRMNMEEAAVRAVNPRPAWGMCVYRLESLSRHDLLPKVQTGLCVVWFGSDPVDLPPACRPPTETTADPGTVTGHQPSNAPREGTTYLTPVPPSIVKMPTFGRVVIVFMSLYFDRRVWVARIILPWPWYSYSVAGMPYFPVCVCVCVCVCVFHCVCSLYVPSEERIKQWLSKAKPFPIPCGPSII